MFHFQNKFNRRQTEGALTEAVDLGKTKLSVFTLLFCLNLLPVISEVQLIY